MYKKIIFAVVSSLMLYSAAHGDFTILTESDNWDYIWWGKWWEFSTSNKSKVTINNASTKSVNFNIESFDISWMNFSFWVEDGKTLSQWMFDPAKRHPFRWSYNGLEVSWDWRGCNTLLGKFYVHEYVIWSDNKVEKAAIDFVQYCEEWSKGLYGSLRYNSNIPSGCTKAWSCGGVKKTLNIENKTTNNDDNQTLSTSEIEQIKALKKTYKKKYRTFTSFMAWEYKLSRRKDFTSINKNCKVSKLIDQSENDNIFRENVCSWSYNTIIKEVNKEFTDFVNNREDDGTIQSLVEGRKELQKSIQELLVIKRELKSISSNDSESLRIDLGILLLIRLDHMMHQWAFSM